MDSTETRSKNVRVLPKVRQENVRVLPKVRQENVRVLSKVRQENVRVLSKVRQENVIWSPDASTAEVDFLMQENGRALPIEVKAERNLRAKSLAECIKRYQCPTAIRFSMSEYNRGTTVVDIPLYAVSRMEKEL